jgi:hypothetical protein
LVITFITFCFNDPYLKKNDMGRACSMYGGEERHIQGFGGIPKGKNHWEDLGVDGRKNLRNWGELD